MSSSWKKKNPNLISTHKALFLMFLEKKLSIFKAYNFPTPNSLNIWWNMGFLILLCTGVQVITGVLLTCLVNMGGLSLISKFYVFKEVSLGWALINMHVVVPNLMFSLMYLHMVKSLLFPVYTVLKLWITGVLILGVFMAMVFTGYSLVSSSMGYWALVVIFEMTTFLFGKDFSELIFFPKEVGISNFVLYKVFTMHYLFSLGVLVFMAMHIYYLHKFGSSSLWGGYPESVGFLNLLLVKDLFTGLFLTVLLFYNVFFMPETFLSGEKNIPWGSMDSVEMSVEWYLSMFFVLLSSLNDKSLGMLTMLLLFLLLLFNTFFKSLWGMAEGLAFLLNTLVMTLMVSVSFYVFSSSLHSMSMLLMLLLNTMMESFLMIFYFFSYLPMKE